MALLAAACAPLPRPFSAGPPADAALLPRDRLGVVVLPVLGVDEAAGLAMAEAMAGALRQAEIPATLGGAARDSHFLSGELATAGGGAQRVLIWDLVDASGAVVASLRRETQAAASDLPALAAAAAASAPDVAAILQDQPVAVVLASRAVAIGEVAGAPGDGATALRRALQGTLPLHDVAVAPAGAADTLTLTGEVSLAEKRPGWQVLALRWRVLRPDGGEIGRIEQANEVPAGSLDGAWGALAEAIADGTAAGVADLLAQTAPGR